MADPVVKFRILGQAAKSHSQNILVGLHLWQNPFAIYLFGSAFYGHFRAMIKHGRRGLFPASAPNFHLTRQRVL
jgi:hypothetical protein